MRSLGLMPFMRLMAMERISAIITSPQELFPIFPSPLLHSRIFSLFYYLIVNLDCLFIAILSNANRREEETGLLTAGTHFESPLHVCLSFQSPVKFKNIE